MALKAVLTEPDLEHDPAFRMPALGQHYLGKKGVEAQEQQKWEAEIFEGMDDNDEEAYMSKVMTTSSGRIVGGKRKTTEPAGAPPGGWATAAPTDEQSQGDSVLKTAKMVVRLLACFIQQGGVPSKQEEEAREIQGQLLEGPDMLSFPIEARMRVELANLGA